MDLKKPLKLLFCSVAKLGLLNPHTPNEIALLKAGKKPTGIIGESQLADLKKEIDSGQLVVIGIDKDVQLSVDLYYKPEHQQKIEGVIKLSQKIDSSGEVLTPYQESISALFNRPHDLSKRGRTAEFSWHNSKYLSMHYLARANHSDQKARIVPNDNIDLKKALTIAAEMVMRDELPFYSTTQKASSSSKIDFIDTLIASGKITHTNIILERNHMDGTAYVSQADKKESGQQLYDFNTGKSSPPHLKKLITSGASQDEIDLATEQFIGRTLGYTENDISFSFGQKYQAPIIRELMVRTNTIRRNMRAHVMLNDWHCE